MVRDFLFSTACVLGNPSLGLNLLESEAPLNTKVKVLVVTHLNGMVLNHALFTYRVQLLG
jgi:hypothetical protein